MKITFVGNFDVDYTTESHHRLTYQQLGHEVIALREAKTPKHVILGHALGSDMLVWTHTHDWHTEGMSDIFAACKQKNIPTIGYHLDLFLGIRREIDLDTDPYWSIEYFFTVDQVFAEKLQEKGVKAYFLPAGIVETECYIAEPNAQKYPHEVVFVGSKNYHPEWQYRPQLLAWLQEKYGNKFGHYGGDGLGVIRGKDLNTLYASAKIVVGDTLCKNFTYPYYSSDRLWETIGRGGFLIYPHIKGLDNYFEDKKEVAYYDYENFDQLDELITYYLNHDIERRAIALAGYQRCKQEGTYTQRLQYLLETVANDRISKF